MWLSGINFRTYIEILYKYNFNDNASKELKSININ